MLKKLICLTIFVFLFTLQVYSETFTVKRVIDCRTLELENGEEVVLIGLQCPDSEEMGQRATEFVIEQFQGGSRFLAKKNEVKLEFDVQERDKEGRLLAYVSYQTEFIDPVISTIDVHEQILNLEIVRAGYALPTTIPPKGKYADLFQEFYNEAILNNRGLWMPEFPCHQDSDCRAIISYEASLKKADIPIVSCEHRDTPLEDNQSLYEKLNEKGKACVCRNSRCGIRSPEEASGKINVPGTKTGTGRFKGVP